jgi:hypothetical protein
MVLHSDNLDFEIKTHRSEMWVDGITNRAASAAKENPAIAD